MLRFFTEDAATLFPKNASKSFSKDQYLEESVETTDFLVYHTRDQHLAHSRGELTYVLLVKIVPDASPNFRKVICEASNKKLSNCAQNILVGVHFLGASGRAMGCTMHYDLDQNGKRTRERAKSVSYGMKVRNFRLTSSNFTNCLTYLGA